jgi:hypothetical protein
MRRRIEIFKWIILIVLILYCVFLYVEKEQTKKDYETFLYIKSINTIKMLDENLTRKVLILQAVEAESFLINIGKSNKKNPINEPYCKYFKDLDSVQQLIQKYLILPKDLNITEENKKNLDNQQKDFQKGIIIIKNQCGEKTLQKRIK